jgi:hypothetical protein
VWWIGLGIFHSFVATYVPIFIFEQGGLLGEEGKNNDMWSLSITVFTAVLNIVNFKLL